MKLHDFDIPPCPDCGKEEMYHLCVSHVPGTASFRKNGWYCKSCGIGPKQLGSASEAEAARLALVLLNK